MPTVDIVLTDNFPLLSLALITEPLRVANRELGEAVWNWRLRSAGGGAVSSSSGFSLETEPLGSDATDVVLLLSSYRPEAALAKPLLAWLRRKSRTGATMGCVDTGALIFAEAGLLDAVPAATHFEALRGYRDTYDDRMFADRLFDVSENRCSSAGGVATFDMTLGLIGRYCGRDLSTRVAEILTYRPTEFEGPQQKLLAETSIMRLDRNLGRAIDLMLAHIEDPLPISAVAGRIDIPEWSLVRLFKRHLKQTPSHYYRQLRLSQARNLLQNSSYRINEIGRLCGFENPETLARAYRRHYGHSPSEERN